MSTIGELREEVGRLVALFPEDVAEMRAEASTFSQTKKIKTKTNEK